MARDRNDGFSVARAAGAAAEAGFTFLELLLVLLILSTLVVLAAPRFTGTTEGLRVSEGGRMLIAFSRAARSRAVTTGRAQALEVDPTARTVRVLPGRDPLAPSAGEADPEVDTAAEDVLALPTSLPEGVVFARTDGGQAAGGARSGQAQAAEAKAVRAWFSPDGSADALEVEVGPERGEGDRLIFRLDPLLGRGSLLDAEPGEVRP